MIDVPNLAGSFDRQLRRNERSANNVITNRWPVGGWRARLCLNLGPSYAESSDMSRRLSLKLFTDEIDDFTETLDGRFA